MVDKKYVYTVSVFDFDSDMIQDYSHDKEYTQYEFSLIVQDCIDEVIMDYAKQKEFLPNDEPCLLDLFELIRSPPFIKSMRTRGFDLIKPQAVCRISNSKVFSTEFGGSDVLRERYSSLSLGYCRDCYRTNEEIPEEYEECPVQNKRN